MTIVFCFLMQSQWVMRTNKKKKHQTPVTQGIDTIISTSQTAPSQTPTAAPSKTGGTRQPRGKGAQTLTSVLSKLHSKNHDM